MYFSKIRLKPHLNMDEVARIIPRNLYAEHQLVWQWFAEDGVKNRDFLFRREKNDYMPIFYTLSKRKPVDDKHIWLIESSVFEPKLQSGQSLRFMLRVNPVVTRKNEAQKRVRDDVIMHAKMKNEEGLPQGELVQTVGNQWLTKQGEQHGFVINASKVSRYFQHRLYKPRQKSTEAIRFSTIDFEGVLRVTEPNTFIDMLYQGLGKSKSFGCGLMLVKRV